MVYEGKLTSLRRVKDDVKEVSHGLECGVRTDGFSSWKEGDAITAFQVGVSRCVSADVLKVSAASAWQVRDMHCDSVNTLATGMACTAVWDTA